MPDTFGLIAEYKGFKIGAYAVPMEDSGRWTARFEFLSQGKGSRGAPSGSVEVARVFGTRDEALQAAVRKAQGQVEQMGSGDRRRRT
jgi:hypothetical protein